MAWTTRKWYGLRDTLAYITDPADQGFVGHNLADAVLPVFPLSVTVGGDAANTGWVVGAAVDGARNRSAGVDVALAGTHYVANTSGGTDFVIDGIPPGYTYGVRIAAGDPFGFGTTKPHIKIYDGTTLRATLDGTAGITDFMDASGANRTDTAWRAGNTQISVDLVSTTGTGGTAKLVFRCGDSAVSGNTALNAIGIIQLTALSGGPTLDAPPTIKDGEAFSITGTNLGSVTALSIGGKDILASIASNTSTGFDATVSVDQASGTDLKLSTDYTLSVTTALGTATATVQIAPATNHLATTIGTPNPTATYRFAGVPDLVTGGQIDTRAWDTSLANVTLNDDGSVTFESGTTFPVTCEARYCDPSGPTWDSFVSQTFTFTSDTTPNAFSFVDQTGATTSSTVTSASVTPTGFTAPTTVSVSGGLVSINGGTATASPPNLEPGDTISAVVVSSASPFTAVSATVTIGGVSDTFTVTTGAGAGDTTPSAFSFASQTGVALSTTIDSDVITPTGYDTGTTVVVSGCLVSINGGGFTSSPPNILPGQTIQARVTSSLFHSTLSLGTVVIGGVSGTFSVTTLAATAARVTSSTGDTVLINVNETAAAQRKVPFTAFATSDGAAQTGLTFSTAEIRVAKPGAGFADSAGTVTELAYGVYEYNPTAGEVDTLGVLKVVPIKSGTKPLVAVAMIVSQASATAAAAIQAKTDQLTFSKTEELDVNLQSINGVTLTGTGAVGNEFSV